MTEPGRHEFAVLSTEDVYAGRIIALRVDEVAMPGGGHAKREVVEHHGAVAIVAEAYESEEISERHRHRYEVNNAYRDKLAQAGLRFSGTSPDGRLVEFIELDRERHPFFVATQAHPELKSRPTRPHPLFAAFVRAAVEYAAADELPVGPLAEAASVEPEAVAAP